MAAFERLRQPKPVQIPKQSGPINIVVPTGGLKEAHPAPVKVQSLSQQVQSEYTVRRTSNPPQILLTRPQTLAALFPAWQSFFDLQTMLRGQTYYRSRNVQVFSSAPDGTGFVARVQGGRQDPYLVTFSVDPAGKPQGTCSCPVGSRCKHVAASLFVAVEQMPAMFDLFEKTETGKPVSVEKPSSTRSNPPAVTALAPEPVREVVKPPEPVAAVPAPAAELPRMTIRRRVS